ncbi:MAG: hypothetical protein LBR90_00375 [Elusimicrobiota bacterium]|jgi:PTS system mannose-specific IIA component|nr:hypothetical protein [Elusimicrobiota bacterium]
MVKIILITHGALGRALLDTAAGITPLREEDVAILSVGAKADLEAIKEQIKTKIDPRGTLILADAFGGTACNLPAAVSHGMSNVFVLTGLNLNMLLTALNHRADMPAPVLAKKVLEDGLKSIVNATDRLR